MEDQSVQIITPVPPVKKSKAPLFLLIIGLIVIFLIFFISYAVTFFNANKQVVEKGLILEPNISSTSSFSISEEPTNVKLLDKFEIKISDYNDLVTKYGIEKIEKNGLYMYRPKNVATNFTVEDFLKPGIDETPFKHIGTISYTNDNLGFKGYYINPGDYTGCCGEAVDLNVSTGTISYSVDNQYLTDKEPWIQVIKLPKTPTQYVVMLYLPGNFYDKTTKVKERESFITDFNGTTFIRIVSDLSELSKGSLRFYDSFGQGDLSNPSGNGDPTLDDKLFSWNSEAGEKIRIGNIEGLEQLAYGLALTIVENSKISE